MVGFEKPLPQKEGVDAGEDDGETEYEQESNKKILLRSRDRQTFKSKGLELFAISL